MPNNNKIIGWIFIILGLAIALTPFTPGSVLLIVGMEMVFGDAPQWKKFKAKMKKLFWT